MKTLFNVAISNFKTIEELPNAWSKQDYLNLLELLEFGDTTDIAPEELKDMCLMALSDNEPDEAAKITLDYIFKDRLNAGQKDNLSHEMIDEKIWEEYADLSMHEEFFNATQLLYQAFNGKFPHPIAVKFNVTIKAKKAEDLTVLNKDTEAVLLRLLVKGMPENTLINRLFKDEVEGESSFPAAKDIIWQFKKIDGSEDTVNLEIISSTYWFNDLKFTDTFEAETHADEVIIA